MLRLVQRKVCRLVSLVTLVILVSSQATVQALGDRTSESQPLARQGKQLGISEPEQKYDLDISFPIDADEAVNNEGRRERIDELIQAILNDQELVSVLHISVSISQHLNMCISYQTETPTPLRSYRILFFSR